MARIDVLIFLRSHWIEQPAASGERLRAARLISI
jgi:hypothetical protein